MLFGEEGESFGCGGERGLINGGECGAVGAKKIVAERGWVEDCHTRITFAVEAEGFKAFEVLVGFPGWGLKEMRRFGHRDIIA